MLRANPGMETQTLQTNICSIAQNFGRRINLFTSIKDDLKTEDLNLKAPGK